MFTILKRLLTRHEAEPTEKFESSSTTSEPDLSLETEFFIDKNGVIYDYPKEGQHDCDLDGHIYREVVHMTDGNNPDRCHDCLLCAHCGEHLCEVIR